MMHINGSILFRETCRTALGWLIGDLMMPLCLLLGWFWPGPLGELFRSDRMLLINILAYVVIIPVFATAIGAALSTFRRERNVVAYWLFAVLAASVTILLGLWPLAVMFMSAAEVPLTVKLLVGYGVFVFFVSIWNGYRDAGVAKLAFGLLGLIVFPALWLMAITFTLPLPAGQLTERGDLTLPEVHFLGIVVLVAYSVAYRVIRRAQQ